MYLGGRRTNKISNLTVSSNSYESDLIGNTMFPDHKSIYKKQNSQKTTFLFYTLYCWPWIRPEYSPGVILYHFYITDLLQLNHILCTPHLIADFKTYVLG